MTGPRSAELEGVPPQSSTRERMGALLGNRKRAVGGLVISSILSGFAEAGILAILAQVAASLVNRAKQVTLKLGPEHVHVSVHKLFILAVGFALVRLALQAPLSILPARIAADVQARLRRDLYHAFSRASWEVQSSDREGHLQETMTSQVLQATGGALQSTSLITALFQFLVLMISAVALNAEAAGAVLVLAVLLFAVLRPLRALGRRSARALSRAQLEYAGGIGESIRVAEETHVFGVGRAQRERIDGFIGKAQGLFFQTQLLVRLIPNLYQSLIYLMVVVGLAALYSSGHTHPATLGAVVLLLVRAATYGQTVQGSYQQLQQSLPFIDRLADAERRYTESTPPAGERPLEKVETLAFDHVGFSYRAERPVLSDVTFEVDRGEAIGVVGPTGAGKSTLIQILLQLRTASEGQYLVNGVPAEQFKREDWQRQVAYVPQEPRLLHASVAENIRYFRPWLDDEAVERAARLALIHDDIVGWQQGYDTIVGPRADAVSGGQQQRICLARALVAHPAVLVLDEPTSALDPHSETVIQESLTALKHELTLFIVAHRMSTLDMCDRVMVILDGTLAAFDTRDSLQRGNDYYRSATRIAAGTSGNGGAVMPAEVPTEDDALRPRDGAGALRPRDGAGALRPRDGDGALRPPGGAAAAAGGGLPADGGPRRETSPDPPAPAGASGTRFPDFFIVGHPKCGTTALYEMVARHPQIYMPDLKEPHFFSNDMRVLAPARLSELPDTLEQYLALFAQAAPAQLVGEASTTYLWARNSAARIAEVQPDARIIAILREPASFLRSLHLQYVQAVIETEYDLRTALSLEQARREGRDMPRYSHWPELLLYSDHVRYVEQLQRFHAAFPAEQVLVLIYDDFRDENEATLRRVLRFLEVNDSAAFQASEANPTVTPKSQRLHELIHTVSVGRGPVSLALKSGVKALTPQQLRRQALEATRRRLVYGEASPADEGLMRELRARFKGEVVDLSEYLNRDLVHLWRYDEIE